MLLFIDHKATWEFVGRHLIIMEKEVAHIRMNNSIHISILLYRFPLFFVVLWFLAIDAHVAFDIFAEHIVAIIASSSTFKFQTIFF